MACRSPGQEAERLAGLHRGTSEDDALDPLPGQRLDRLGHRQVGLAGAGGPDADYDVVVADGLEVVALALGLGYDGAAEPGQHDLAVRGLGRELAGGALGGQPGDIVRRDRLTHPGQLEQDPARPVPRAPPGRACPTASLHRPGRETRTPRAR